MIENRNIKIVRDRDDNRIVLINDVRFKGKKRIDWESVKSYIEGYIGDYYEISESAVRIYIGRTLSDEFTASEYTKSLRGGNAKAKANAATAIPELIQIATKPKWEENKKEKHSDDARFGWYRYDVKFAIPIYDDDILTHYNIFGARLLVNHARNGKRYLYDILAIKKEMSKPHHEVW